MDIARITQLDFFLSLDGLPEGENRVLAVLQSPMISEVRSFALGPIGNNIQQASERWINRMGIRPKSKVILCDTPELCLQEARKVLDDNVVSVFWTCSVYYKLNIFFFTNPDILPFFFTEVMPLDEMQLALNPRLASEMPDFILSQLTIATHPSPAPLLKDQYHKIIFAKSNAHAARLCKDGEVDACITTETARKIYNLVKVHSFGSPRMVFFGGITAHTAEILRTVYQNTDHFQATRIHSCT